MILSQMKYQRDMEIAQSGPVKPSDIRYLLTEYITRLKRTDHAFCNLHQIEPKFEEMVMDATVMKLEQTEKESPNTVVTLRLPEESRVRGEINVTYNRLAMDEYFNISRIIEDEEMTVELDYNEWVEALKGHPDVFRGFIHRLFSHKLGRSFSDNGIILVEKDTRQDVIKDKYPLALLVPSLRDIDYAWRRSLHVKHGKDNGHRFNYLTVKLRFVARDHMFIEDGEIHLNVRLRRDPMSYETAVRLDGGN